MSDLPSTSVPTSAVMYRVAGKARPLKSVRQCKTCNSEYRLLIEHRLLQGHTYRMVAESLPEESGLSQANIKAHYLNKHMPMEETARRALIEARAREMGFDVDDQEEILVDHVAMLRTGIGLVHEQMAVREVMPTISEGIRMARALAAIEAIAADGDDDGNNLEEIEEGVRLIMATAQRIMSIDQYQEFSRQLLTNDYLLNLMGHDVSKPAEAPKARDALPPIVDDEKII